MATSQEVQQLHQTMKDFVQSQSRLTEETRRAKQAITDMNDELSDYETTLGSTAKLTKKQNELYNKAYDAKQKELHLGLKLSQTQKRLDDLNGRIAAAGTATIAQEAERATITQLLNTRTQNHRFALDRLTATTERFNHVSGGTIGSLLRLQESAGGLGGGFSGLVGRLGVVGVVLGGLTSLIGVVVDQGLKAVDIAGKTMANTSGVIEGPNVATGIRNQIIQAATRGIDFQAFSNMTTESRQTVNAMGGLNRTLELSDTLAREYVGATGDINEAYKQSILTIQSFAQKGIKPTNRSLIQFNNDILQTSKLAGLSLEQSRAMYDRVGDELSSQKLLRLARIDERGTILANQRALLNSNIALGMLPAQAEAAAKSLTELAGAKVMTKIETGANMRALFAAMGLGKEGATFQKELSKMHPDTNKLRDSVVELQKVMDKRAIAGGTTQQLYQQSLMASLKGTESVMGDFGEKYGILGAPALAKPEVAIDAKYSEFRNTMMADMVAAKQMTQNNAKALTDGTGALLLATKTMGDFLSTQSNFIPEYREMMRQVLDDNTGVLSKMGRLFTDGVNASGMALIRLGEVLAAPFQAIAGVFNSTGAILSELIAKLAGFFGLEGVEKIWTNVSNTAFENAKGYYSQIMPHWDSVLSKQTETVKNSIPKEQPKPQQVIDIEKEKLAKDAQINTADFSRQILETAQSQNNSISNQVNKLDESSRYLKILADNSIILINLAEKQLAAATMTIEEKTKYASVLKRSDLAFGAEFATIK